MGYLADDDDRRHGMARRLQRRGRWHVPDRKGQGERGTAAVLQILDRERSVRSRFSGDTTANDGTAAAR
jgi:hypothetical protein